MLLLSIVLWVVSFVLFGFGFRLARVALAYQRQLAASPPVGEPARRTNRPVQLFVAAPANAFVASTSARLIETSKAECPESGTTTSSASGQARCNVHALVIGQT